MKPKVTIICGFPLFTKIWETLNYISSLNPGFESIAEMQMYHL